MPSGTSVLPFAQARCYDDAIDVLDVNRTLATLAIAYRFTSRGRIVLEGLGGTDNERQSGSPYGNSKSGARLSLNTAIGESAYLFASVGSLTRRLRRAVLWITT